MTFSVKKKHKKKLSFLFVIKFILYICYSNIKNQFMKKVLLSLLTLALTLGSCNQEPESYENKPLNSFNEVEKRGWITLEQSKTSAVNYLNNQNKFDAKNSNIPKFTERDIEETLGILDDKDNTLIYIHNLRHGGFYYNVGFSI